MKTFILRLGQSAVFRKEIRQNVRRGDEAGLALCEVDEAQYLPFLVKFRESKGLEFKGFDHGILRDLHFYAAYHNGEPVCGQALNFDGDRATEVALWRTYNCPYYATDWLKHSLFNAARERGAKIYDFAGAAGYYKEKWGGELVDDGRPEVKPHPLAGLKHRFLKYYFALRRMF